MVASGSVLVTAVGLGGVGGWVGMIDITDRR